MVSLDILDGMITVSFPYSDEQIRDIKRITSHWSKRLHAWLVSLSRIEEIYRAFPHTWTSPRLQQWLDLQKTVEAHKTSEAPQPYWVACELRPHQRSAVKFLLNFAKAGLFEAPGTGKSRTAIAWAMKRHAGPRLIVCPAAVKYHWAREIKACDPNAEVFVVQGTSGPLIAPAPWIILNFDILAKRAKDLPQLGVLIGDEMHLAKSGKLGDNAKGSKRGNAVLKLATQTPNVLALTGSPVMNRPAELEPILLALGQLHPRERFAWRVEFCDGKRVLVNPKGVQYCGKAEKWVWNFKGSSNADLLARELDTFSLRRPFSQIAGSLPPVTHTLLEIDLPDLREHDAMRREMLSLLHSGDPLAKGQALAMMGKMITWTGNQKAAAVGDLVEERLLQGESTIVFSDFLAPLGMLRERFNGRSLMLDGSLPQEAREGVIRQFVESPTPQALLGSRRAMGTGLDGLQQRSRTCLFLTLPWTPAAHQQAAGRLSRDGQTRPVEVITTMARGTVDEAQLRLIYGKARITDMICNTPMLDAAAMGEWQETLNLLGN